MGEYHSLKGIISLIAAVIGYAIWYRIEVGPWCPAMWFGSAPPFFIGLMTLLFYRILDKVR